jgi:splicing factor 3A subunit 3
VIVKDYKQDAKTHKEKLMQNHRVRKRIDDMQTIANKLVRKAAMRQRAQQDSSGVAAELQ